LSRDDELPRIRHRWGERSLSLGKVAAGAARIAGRRVFGAEEGLADAELGASMARELDGMKGLSMKVGQILSYMDGVLPEPTQAALRHLQRGSRPVAFEVIEAAIAAAFDGSSVDSLFESFERVPVAAASIGQVHRARYGGQDVAVKVQYPEVRRTFESDFSKLRGLARFASLATAVDGLAIADELRDRIVEECDYSREADAQDEFRRALAHVDSVVVPAIVRERTRASVLTSEWMEGDDFYTFLERSDPARRNRAALTLVETALHSLFAYGAIQADPHPGNYVFLEDGRVALLDFGCVHRFDPGYLAAERRLASVVVDDRRADFDAALLATGMVPKPAKFDFDVHYAMVRHLYAPYTVPHFRFTSAYIREGARFNGPGNPNLRRLAIPPSWIWIQRLLVGLHSVLTRLGAEGDFRAIMRRALAREIDAVAQGSVTKR
jgi:predicted unusual protein kinase regulating ubiquinone biosynthesis (AarF/ABC1/UbiB family)